MRGTPTALVACVRPVVALIVVATCSSGCWLSHEREPRSDLPVCGTEPRCMRRSSPCAPFELVAPECTDVGWRCPPGSEMYRPPWPDDTCLPLEGRLDDGLFSDGVHEAPVPVAIGDRCTWVFPFERDGQIDLAAIDVAWRCDELDASDATMPISSLEGDLDYVALQASFTDADGQTRVLARGWRFDPTAPFGVRGLGAGLGTVRDGRIVVRDQWLFDEGTDLGDAAIVVDDFLYAYGCPGDPHSLEEDCIVGRAPLARIDDRDAWVIFGDGGWGEGAPRRVFGSGPHRSAVFEDPRGSGFIHVFAIGFGRELQMQTSPSPEGPWTAPQRLSPCDLPPDDEGAYCAGPAMHAELLDPLDPSTLYVSYSVGTTSEDGAERRARNPAAYWPRAQRIRLH